jgi:hypothetical protein
MFSITKRSFEPIERIEFGFVLLPDDDVLQEIKQMSEIITSLLQPLVWRSNLPPFWGTYVNRNVLIPHISIGQYGVLGCEVESLKSIVQGACEQICQIRDAMKSDLSILENHIFFDLNNCFERVNPEISKAPFKFEVQHG